MVWYGMVCDGMVCMIWHVWYGMIWYVMVWYGMIWYGMACMVSSLRFERVIRVETLAGLRATTSLQLFTTTLLYTH